MGVIIMQNSKLQKGELILFTTGEYSDFSNIMLVKVLKNFDIQELQDAGSDNFIEIYKTSSWFSYTKFRLWLIEQGYIEELSYREYWLDG